MVSGGVGQTEGEIRKASLSQINKPINPGGCSPGLRKERQEKLVGVVGLDVEPLVVHGRSLKPDEVAKVIRTAEESIPRAETILNAIHANGIE